MHEFKFCPVCASPLQEEFIDGAPRRVCATACGFIHYDNPTPVVAAIVEHDGCVVLARNRAWPVTWYGLITGFLERGESPAQGVLREVGEELGLAADTANLVGAYTFDRMNQVIIAYHVPATGAIVLNDELVDYRRVPPPECHVWRSGTGDALRDWLRGRGIEPDVIERVR
jgi:NADH pyrophosphatase NudC (nudix superfamily)